MLYDYLVQRTGWKIGQKTSVIFAFRSQNVPRNEAGVPGNIRPIPRNAKRIPRSQDAPRNNIAIPRNSTNNVNLQNMDYAPTSPYTQIAPRDNSVKSFI